MHSVTIPHVHFSWRAHHTHMHLATARTHRMHMRVLTTALWTYFHYLATAKFVNFIFFSKFPNTLSLTSRHLRLMTATIQSNKPPISYLLYHMHTINKMLCQFLGSIRCICNTAERMNLN